MPGPLGATITTTAFQHRKAKSMNNTDLAEKIAAEQGITKADARKIVDAVFAGIGEAAAKGEEIALNGFGKFKIKDSPAREGRNPATGEPMTIKASRKRSEEHTSELQSLMRISYAVFCLKNKINTTH